MSYSMQWAVPIDKINKYESMFISLQPKDNKISAQQAKSILMESKLSVDILGNIWNLSDIDKDGCLDRHEFTLAMYLVSRCLEGEVLPAILPSNLIPPNKTSKPIIPQIIIPSPTSSFNASYGDASIGSPNLGPLQQSPNWRISSEELSRFNVIFASLDEDADGLVSGLEVRKILMQSGLPNEVLAQIWSLVDSINSGNLNSEQFAVALHLSNEQLAGRGLKPLPSVLPPDLVPPSMRPIALEPSECSKSKQLTEEIDFIRRERLEIEAAASVLSSGVQSESAGVLEQSLEALRHTASSLVGQRAEADRQLSDYSARCHLLQTTHSEMTRRIEETRARVQNQRSQVDQQQLSIETEEKRISHLREQINETVKEEVSLRDKVAQNRSRLEAAEAETKTITAMIDQKTAQLSTMESSLTQLTQVLNIYAKLLADDTSVAEPDPELISSLTSDTMSIASVSSYDTGLGMSQSVFESTGLFTSRPASAASVMFDYHKTEQPSVHNMIGAKSLSNVSSDPFCESSLNNFDPFSKDAEFKEDPFFGSAVNTEFADPFAGTHLNNKADPFQDLFDSGKPDLLPNYNSAFSVSTPKAATDPFDIDSFAISNASRAKIPPKRPVSRSKPSTKPVQMRRLSSSSGRPARDGPNKAPASFMGSSKVASHTGTGGISEADQLSWAVSESRRLSQMEKSIQRQEQDDLMLALSLSRMQ